MKNVLATIKDANKKTNVYGAILNSDLSKFYKAYAITCAVVGSVVISNTITEASTKFLNDHEDEIMDACKKITNVSCKTVASVSKFMKSTMHNMQTMTLGSINRTTNVDARSFSETANVSGSSDDAE